MRDYEELVKELRDCRNKAVFSEYWWNITADAADAIEELMREYESMAKSVNKAAEILRNRKPKWISVEERLPEAGNEVLAFGDTYGIDVTLYTRERFVSGSGVAEGVTHWIPLPEKPEEDE